MNLVVSFVILFCLACSEFSTAGQADNLWLRLAGIALITALVPGLAFVQTTLIARSLPTADCNGDTFERLCNRVSSCHTAVWLTASIAIVYVFRWHDVVRGNWDFDRFVLVDELLILTPIVFSLVASWLVFSELPQAWSRRIEASAPAGGTTVPATTANLRWKFVALRIRLYILVLAIPLCLAILLSDLMPTLLKLSSHSISAVAILFVVASALITLLLARLPWNSYAPSAATRSAFQREVAADRLPPRLLIWNTGDQIINASASGILPWFQRVWISDRLQKLFPPSELQAIIRHELAHLRHRHVAIRTSLLFLPLMLWSGLGWLVHGDSTLAAPTASYCEISPFAASLCLSFLYVIYSLALLRIASHAFEFQADLSASCQRKPTRTYELCPERLQSTKAALQRLSVCMPHQVNRETIFHPSLAARIQRLQRWQQAQINDAADASIRKSFKASIVAAVAIVFLLTSIIALLPA